MSRSRSRFELRRPGVDPINISHMIEYFRQCHADLPGDDVGGGYVSFDFYMPDVGVDAQPLTLVVLIHGGGWCMGSSDGLGTSPWALEMAAEGLAVASINYRLAPTFIAPAAIQDAKLAIRFLRSRHERYKIDPNRIVAFGHSAGGHLASMIGVTRKGDGFDTDSLKDESSQVAAVVDISGITNVAALLAPPTRRDWAETWMGPPMPPPAPDRKKFALKCSPITYADRTGLPPFLIIHGDKDEAVPYDQSVQFQRKLSDAGNDATLVTIKGGGHRINIRGPVDWQRQIRAVRREFFQRLGLYKNVQPDLDT